MKRKKRKGNKAEQQGIKRERKVKGNKTEQYQR